MIITKKINELKNIIKMIKTPTGSLIFLRIIATIILIILLIPVITWLYAYYTHDESEWVFKMLDMSLKIIDHTVAPSAIAGVTAIAGLVVDANNNGISDELERFKNDEKN